MIGLNAVPVFPVNDQKRPLNRNGHKGAFPCRRVPKEWPLVGVPTGSASGLSVIDVDVPDGAGWYDANYDALPLTQVHETRRGGLHLLYKAVPGLRCSTGRIASGIDVRSDGGFIVWWPREGLPAEDWPLCEMPDWLVKAAMGPVIPREHVGSIDCVGNVGPREHVGSVGRHTRADAQVDLAEGDAHTIAHRLHMLPRQAVRAAGIAPTRHAQNRLAFLRSQLRGPAPSKRNDILFWVSCRFAEMIAEGLVRPKHAIDDLGTDCWANGLLKEPGGEHEFIGTVTSAFRTVERQLNGAWRRSNGGPE
jgi:hypothetical protein